MSETITRENLTAAAKHANQNLIIMSRDMTIEDENLITVLNAAYVIKVQQARIVELEQAIDEFPV